jgi:hypothetical protein
MVRSTALTREVGDPADPFESSSMSEGGRLWLGGAADNAPPASQLLCCGDGGMPEGSAEAPAAMLGAPGVKDRRLRAASRCWEGGAGESAAPPPPCALGPGLGLWLTRSRPPPTAAVPLPLESLRAIIEFSMRWMGVPVSTPLLAPAFARGLVDWAPAALLFRASMGKWMGVSTFEAAWVPSERTSMCASERLAVTSLISYFPGSRACLRGLRCMAAGGWI